MYKLLVERKRPLWVIVRNMVAIFIIIILKVTLKFFTWRLKNKLSSAQITTPLHFQMFGIVIKNTIVKDIN